MAKLLALSPYVKIKVHLSELRVPASFASSSLGMPVNFDFLAPPVILANLESYLCFASLYISSTIPVLRRSFMNFSLRSHFDPNKDCFKVKVYLV